MSTMTEIERLALLSSLSESELFRYAVRSQHLARLHGSVDAGTHAALQEIADARAAGGAD